MKIPIQDATCAVARENASLNEELVRLRSDDEASTRVIEYVSIF